MPKNDLKTYKKTLFFLKGISFNIWQHNLERPSLCGTAAQWTDANLTDKITKFAALIAAENTS